MVGEEATVGGGKGEETVGGEGSSMSLACSRYWSMADILVEKNVVQLSKMSSESSNRSAGQSS